MISTNIRIFREKLGYSQKDIADYLDVSQAYVSQLENGERSISTKTVSKLALLFNVDDFDLYSEDPKEMEIFSSLAFRANEFTADDQKILSNFKKIILNHYNLKKAILNDK